MIQLAEDVEYLESRKVPLSPTFKKVLIEVASNRKIDIAVIDEDQAQQFDESEAGDDVVIDWYWNVRTQDFESVIPQDNKKRYLILWNSNENANATIAYKFTALE